MRGYALACVGIPGHAWGCVPIPMRTGAHAHTCECVSMRSPGSGSGSWMGRSRMRRGVQGRVRVGGATPTYGATRSGMRVCMTIDLEYTWPILGIKGF
jgi:hypothetical protein